MTSYTIEQAAICDGLAKELYQAHATFYGLEVPDFATLSYRTKKTWIMRALEGIEAVGPSRSKVIAQITEAAPWGLPVHEGHAR